MNLQAKTREELQEEVQRLYERVSRLEEMVSEHREMAEALRLSEAGLAAAQRISHLGNWDWDIRTDALRWSDEIYRIFGLSPREFGATYEAFLHSVHPDDRESVVRAVNEALHERKPYGIDHRVVRPDGTERIVHEQAEVTYDAEGKPVRMIGTVQDITDFRRTEERLNHLAHFDGLTHLPNRTLFFDRLRQELSRAHWRNRLVAVLLLNIDQFRLINDTLGHDAGDLLIQEVAKRLAQVLREGDTVARLGGDEFALILEDVHQEYDIPKVAQKILDTLAAPFVINGREIFFTASIGIGIHPNDGDEAEILVKNTHTALHQAKELGRNNYRLYSPAMNARAFERLVMETCLRRALERDEFLLMYQPQLDLRTGAVLGVEALLRWRHPEMGVVPPGTFISILEETGLIVPVGEWVLRAACAQGKAWREGGFPNFRMAVNLSPLQFKQPDLVETVSRSLRETGMNPGGLELELTESVLMQYTESTVATLRAWNAQGVHLALDDFGTGFSSLSYLKRFAIDSLKIDRSFVQDVTTNPEDAIIVKGIIALAHNLRIQVVAEGVETAEQMAFLREHGCDQMQGYHFSPAVPADEITRLLKEGRRLPTGHAK
ncbi:MAG: EAL domain-containing protein [Nitrospirae bacterium]|nr:EAL domain-containing protein [Nitrospirota bacterium]